MKVWLTVAESAFRAWDGHGEGQGANNGVVEAAPGAGNAPNGDGGSGPAVVSAAGYIDPATGFLRNLVGATSQEEIDRVVSDLLPGRLEELEAGPIPCTGDRAQLKAIHRVLFYEIFEWAGQFRTIDIDKAGTDFVSVAELDTAIEKFGADLAQENLLAGLPRQLFIERLAHFYARLNQIHPFREGNGRTQRLFWMEVALHAGWQVNLLAVPKDVNDEASRAASQDGDLQPLINMLGAVTTPAPGVARGKAQIRATLRRRQRDRRVRRWLQEHANPSRMRPADPGDT
jgi:cell filamentation protein